MTILFAALAAVLTLVFGLAAQDITPPYPSSAAGEGGKGEAAVGCVMR